jgi:hypothetical protein
MASAVLLSALSIKPYDPPPSPLGPGEEDVDMEKDRILRIASILGFSVVRRAVLCCATA